MIFQPILPLIFVCYVHGAPNNQAPVLAQVPMGNAECAQIEHVKQFTDVPEWNKAYAAWTSKGWKGANFVVVTNHDNAQSYVVDIKDASK